MTSSLNYTSLPSLWKAYNEMPRQLACRAQTQSEWVHWREALLAKLEILLGGLPSQAPPLEPVLLESWELPDYRLEKVAFQSEIGLYIPCYVLIPHHIKPPYRPVIALHGHGSGGAAHVVGLVVNETSRAEEEAHIRTHNYDYAHQLALQGFMVFAPEQRGFGERKEEWPNMVSGSELWRSSCRAVAFNALLLGKTLIGMRVWDVMRTIDYIENRPEPMQAGVGCLGLSGGGTTTLFASALEPRITAAVVSGAFNSFRASIMPVIHCECNYIPDILKYAEMADIAGLIAPRPLLIENGTEDPIFPVAVTEAAYAEVSRIYDLLGASERLDKDIFVGGHRFSGRKALTWLQRWLAHRDSTV